jgi:CHAT domain-containing protein/cytochrome c-type biogenesis protein CcmH/NrfG
VNLARDHLSLQEIEWLAESSRQTRPAAQTEEARLHLGGCEFCQGMVKMYEELKAPGEERGGPNCAEESTWWNVATGLLPESRAAELLEHSTRCDACALLFRQATEDLTDELTEQETTQIRALLSTQQEWQQSLAQRLSATESDRSEPGIVVTPVGRGMRDLVDWFSWQPRNVFRHAWAYAASAIVLLAASAWLLQMWREPSIDQLVANAYTERRPFEMRIAGAAYGPVRQERAGERSAFAEPATLLRAKYMIKERLAARPDDEAMLAASGRVELLEGHYDEAIRTFGRLLDAHPDSPPLLIELATAYFQRAEAVDRAVDYGQSIELFGRVLAKKPDDTLALFNRAIALERMHAYNEAIRDWEHYLRVDPTGNWGTEAQRRLSELQEKMKARDKPSAMLRSDPGEATPILKARVTGQPTSPASWPVFLDEEYLDLVVREWLTLLYVPSDSHGKQAWRRDPTVWDVLTVTAEALRTYHKDVWLGDVLRDLPPDSAPANTVGKFVRAFDSLARATKANVSGDPDSALPLAQAAADSFRLAKCNSGYLRAREEIIYSLVRAGRVQNCIQAAGQQLREKKLGSYPWLQGQAILWQAACQGYAGNLGLAQQLSEHALVFTENTAYAGQHLRSILFASGFLRSTEHHWQDTRSGLQKFWKDLHNPFHGYESYLELAFLADAAEQWHLAFHLHREAMGMIERTPDRSFRAMAHYDLAVAAMRVEDLTEAETEFKSAGQQFAALSHTVTGRLYRVLAEIQWAAVAVQQGKLELAAERLEQARPHLAAVPDAANAFRYYQTLGELHFRRGQPPEAEHALRAALNIAEIELSSLRTDGDRLGWERDAAPAYRTLVELYAQKPEATIRALEIWEGYLASPLRKPMLSSSARNLDRASLDAEPDPRFLQRIRAALPAFKHETVMTFVYLPSGVAAWEFDDRGVNFARIAASREELAARVRDFVHLCGDPYSDLATLRQQGRSLYDLLVAPFERHLEPGRLLIVEPDSILSDVPWPALVDPQQEYLGSHFAIAVSPGLGYWLNLRSPAAISPEKTALVVGMPTIASMVASRFPPLPDADREAQLIASQFRHSRLLFGAEVTSPAIQEEISHSQVFHFAGHAISSVKQSGLVLASLTDSDGNEDEPTLLSASDLEKAALQRLQLVVLSACATAETEKGFTGPDTLVRSFLRAGVPNVVASRWPVDSHTTQQTMTEFYKALFQGQPSTKALQQASNTLRIQPGTSHPYYWAAFGSYGR